MKIAAVLLLCVCALAAAADEAYFDNGTVSITLTRKPCTLPEASVALAQVAPSSHAATVTIPERSVAACWSLDSTGQKVLIVDEDGDAGFVAASQFSATRKPAAKQGKAL